MMITRESKHHVPLMLQAVADYIKKMQPEFVPIGYDINPSHRTASIRSHPSGDADAVVVEMLRVSADGNIQVREINT